MLRLVVFLLLVGEVELQQRELEGADALRRGSQAPGATADVALVLDEFVFVVADELLAGHLAGLLLHGLLVDRRPRLLLAVGYAQLAEHDARQLKLLLDVQLRPDGIAADGHRSAHHQFHMGLQLAILGGGFYKQIGLVLVEAGLGSKEVEAHLVGRLCLEDVGILQVVGLLLLLQLVDVAGVAYAAFDERHVDGAREVTVGEIVLDELQSHVVERESPSAHLAGLGFQQLVGVDGQRGTALVEEHVGGRDAETAVAIDFVAHLHGLGELHAQLLDEHALPGDIAARECLGLVVALGEGSHLVAVQLAVVVDDDILGRKGPARQVVGLEGIHRHVGHQPLIPALYLGLYVKRGLLVGEHTVHLLLQSGYRHVDIDAEQLKLIVGPREEAPVGGLEQIGRCLEGAGVGAVGVFHGEVAQQCQRATLRQEAVRRDAHPRQSEHQNLVVGIGAVVDDELCHDVHRSVGRLKLHAHNLNVARTLVDVFRQSQWHVELFYLALGQQVAGALAGTDVLIILADVELFGQTLGLLGTALLKLVGTGQLLLADELVDAPVAEQSLCDVAIALGVVRVRGGST